jgi:two-component system, chemotaxis family, chemotaxis protein CheY
MPDAKTLKILVVDDQQTMRGLARQCLKKLGVLDVSLAASGEAALETMAQKKFDAVISDLNMPGLSGVDLAKKIKAHPVLKSTPIFLATSDAYRERASDDTVDHFVAKPFSVQDMRTAIEKHLGELT